MSATASEPGPDVELFRQVAGRFATGVTVVTTRLFGLDHAMTANAFTSVSLDPLMVLVCVEQEARFHDAITETGLWAVSILGESGRAASAWFATRGRPLHGQLNRYRHRRGPMTGMPILEDAIAAMECRTHAVYEGGDHSIVVGEVIGLALTSPDAEPLLYFSGRYHTLGDPQGRGAFG